MKTPNPFKKQFDLSGVDQSKVDHSTEEWLDSIEQRLKYKVWYAGHWHINKRIDRIHFLFDGYETLPEEFLILDNQRKEPQL